MLTNKGQPMYLLVDIKGENVVPLINWFDHYRKSEDKPQSIPKT